MAVWDPTAGPATKDDPSSSSDISFALLAPVRCPVAVTGWSLVRLSPPAVQLGPVRGTSRVPMVRQVAIRSEMR